MDRFRIDGRVVIVSGATRGIGRAAALGLAEAGAHVVVLGNTRSPDETVETISGLGRQTPALQGDVRDKTFRDRVLDEVVGKWGRVAVDSREEDCDYILNVNRSSVFLMCQTFGREKLKRKSGKIINMASLQSFTGGITIPAYAASKGGVAQLTKALANEWAHFNVNVNAIAPGYILSDLTQPLYDEPGRSKEIIERIPAQRWGKPEDLQGAVIFLASPASDFVHGHILLVDGGWMAR